MIAFIFPGQGSQKVGMGQEALEKLPGAAEIFERASAVLGYDLRALCLEGPEEALRDTRRAQPALLTVGYLHWLGARSHGLEPGFVAGHSLGEYTALVAAGALDFEAALALVKRRSELMAEAPAGAMAALVALLDQELEAVLDAGRAAGTLVLANDNSPGQIVISGTPDAVALASAAAKARGAKLAVRLPVSGAFHSPLLASAGEIMAGLIDTVPLRDATVPVFQNTTARGATSAGDLRSALRGQMTGPVRWRESVLAMIEAGATRFYELGPGNVLCGLGKRTAGSAEWLAGWVE